jgi:diguanylate cyclase
LIEGGEVRVSATAGMALFPGDGADAEALFRNAEAALKKAKSSGDRYMFYTTEMNAQAGRQLALETRLRASVANETFQIEYQPKIDLLTGHVSGVEALMRWTDVENGPVPPSQFIPILERTGLIVPAGRWIIRQALLDSRQWHAQGLHAQHVAVNVSAIQLRRPDFVEMVAAAVQESGVEFSHLELEVTESLIMDDIADNIRKLRALREMGVSIAVDDFGTGYSSLGYLTKLPITSLKIDRSFIVTMVDNADSMTIVSTIISLAHSLNLKVVAEGVDSEEQRKFLRLLKCDEIQGYLISKPVPPSVLSGLLARKGNGRGPVEVLG